MENLNIIKKQINSILAISKITNAMKVVAVSKTNKMKKMFLESSEYLNDMYKIIPSVMNNLDKLLIHTTKKTQPKTLWILISSSVGMCGAFNINNFKDFSKKILSGDKIIVFGIKGYNFLIKSGRENDIVHYENIDEKGFNYFQLTNISLLIHKLIISHKVNKVNIQYNKFYSSLKQNPESVQIFPINFSKEEYIDVEPSKEEIFNIFFDNYINAILYSCILESKFCEQLARKNAMTEASDNEDKKIKELKLKYNKKRQEKITQEIANISIR